MLVFGQEARDGGLDKSLLERLILEYKTIQFDGSSTSRRFHISLVTNYRCHQDILDLCVKLFYPDTHLRLPVETTMKPQVFEFRKSQSSIHFICSSLLKNKPEHKEEAKTIVDMLVEINKEWPRFGVSSRFDPRKVCIMSKTRSQVRNELTQSHYRFIKGFVCLQYYPVISHAIATIHAKYAYVYFY